MCGKFQGIGAGNETGDHDEKTDQNKSHNFGYPVRRRISYVENHLWRAQSIRCRAHLYPVRSWLDDQGLKTRYYQSFY